MYNHTFNHNFNLFPISYYLFLKIFFWNADFIFGVLSLSLALLDFSSSIGEWSWHWNNWRSAPCEAKTRERKRYPTNGFRDHENHIIWERKWTPSWIEAQIPNSMLIPMKTSTPFRYELPFTDFAQTWQKIFLKYLEPI